MTTQSEIVALITTLAAVLGGLVTIFKIVIPTCRRVIRFSAMMMEIPKRLDAMSLEFKRNGGSTLKDAISRIEAFQHRNEERQKLLLNLVPYGAFEMDSEGSVTYVNRTLLRWSGRPTEELLGEGWITAVDPSQRSTIAMEWSDAFRHRRVFEQNFKMVNNITGDVMPLLAKLTPMPTLDKEQKICGYFGVFYHQTESEKK